MVFNSAISDDPLSIIRRFHRGIWLPFSRYASNRLKGHWAAFRADEDGAATVDWVVGTALAVTMGLAVMNSVSDGVMTLSDRVSETIAGIEFMWGPSEGDTGQGGGGG